MPRYRDLYVAEDPSPVVAKPPAANPPFLDGWMRRGSVDGSVVTPMATNQESMASGTEASVGTARRPTLRRQLSHLGDNMLRRMRTLTLAGPSYLDNVLGQEFVGAQSPAGEDDDDGDEGGGGSGAKRHEPDRQNSMSSLTDEGVKTEFTAVNIKAFTSRLVERKSFAGVFMALTLYALYVPDFDLWLGNKESRFVVGVITTAVSVLFFIEIILQSVGQAQYLCRPYFWLDFVAFISLLPDTYVVEALASNNAFVAGRSSRLTRVLFLATRSSRAARLNRLGRIVRVVAMVPRLQRFFSRGAKDTVTVRLLDKKLQRIFHFLDEDMDGYVSRESAERCLMKLRTLTQPKQTWADQMTHKIMRSRSFTMTPTQRSFTTQISSLRSAASAQESMCSDRPDTPSSPLARRGSMASLDMTCHESDAVNMSAFRTLILEDTLTAAGLRKACRQQIGQSNNMVNVTVRNSEVMGVKVALWVLLLLFLLSLIIIAAGDSSGEYGLTSIDRLVGRQLPNAAAGSQVPMLVQEQVRAWTQSDPFWRPEARKVLYLDLNKRVYCNDFVLAVPRCGLFNSSSLVWSMRTSMEAIDEDLYASQHRIQDLALIRVPELSHLDLSLEEFERRTRAVAVLNVRHDVVHGAMLSVFTTTAVIVIILLGVALVTRDLVFLKGNLLKPLVELADEMESASRLQLAGFSSVDPAGEETGVKELRLIRRYFENMKKAIRSWGKYVPWQVVQALLRKDTEVNVEQEEKEVSIFFSDIANFTSIVEGLPPEKSLLLLSRYFHDMSKIMDEYGGIVIEFIGDAILGIYGAPVANEDHPTAAVKAAIRMIEQLARMNEWLAERLLPTVAIRCGLHTGPALVGNMGFHSRMKYGIVGEESEIPARLEEMNKNYSTKIMISETMCKRLAPDTFVMRPVDFIRLGSGGSNKPEKVYEVIERASFRSRTEQKSEACALHASALQLYRQRDFAEAEQKFKEVHETMGRLTGAEDTPSALLMSRCRSYLEAPPPPEWDGVWDRG